MFFAVGVTGDHLFPAQALARDLREKDPSIEIVFAGGRLSASAFFHTEQFAHKEIASGSPFRGNPLKALLSISRGTLQSNRLIGAFSPDLVIGFGSFYSLPLLMSARMKKIPYLLVESNAIPGRVNRLFSSKALFTALQFDQAKTHFKGAARKVRMPYWAKKKQSPSKAHARQHYELNPDLLTLLVLGGSGGAKAINDVIPAISMSENFQVIHLCGDEAEILPLCRKYEEYRVPAHIKAFERDMDLAFTAADIAICRAGAGTLNELIEYRLPSVLIPWPGASEDHQRKNAEILEAIGGAQIVLQKNISNLSTAVRKVRKNQKEMTIILGDFTSEVNLSDAVLEILVGKRKGSMAE